MHPVGAYRKRRVMFPVRSATCSSDAADNFRSAGPVPKTSGDTIRRLATKATISSILGTLKNFLIVKITAPNDTKVLCVMRHDLVDTSMIFNYAQVVLHADDNNTQGSR